MKAIILAAGRSSRLYPLTIDKPKCLLKINKSTVLEHQIKLLKKCGIEDILIVTGYLEAMIREKLGDSVRYTFYGDFAKNNNLYTLYSVRDELTKSASDVIILFSDVLLGKDLLMRCIKGKGDFRLITDRTNITDKTMRVKIKGSCIYDIGGHIPPESGDGNFIGVAGFTQKGARLVSAEMDSLIHRGSYTQDYYTIVFIDIAKAGYCVEYIDIVNEPWIEIDYEEDYHKAITMFGCDDGDE
ncbi:nucleotidyl transferase [Candidatus Omnitrophus magneticus]|uniref:Nucleotidyl transferase n=1 Tax=Candidatus Omnitrophus magneticus TaxID=1609969 RepID=A0A0F0CPB6_9BACT|nr:nucleotidyl transferase [Candidatus Omnitrophus magneticus]